MNSYVLITAAHNEEHYIEGLIKSVTVQTLKPRRWVIVSDGSTDSTADIITRYARQFSFIHPIITPPQQERSFSSKAMAVNTAYQHLACLEFDAVGILDADVTFEQNYYEQLLPHFDINPELGIIGGFVLDIIDGKTVRRPISINWSVRGPVQTFRRECFEAIGGYRALKYGGIDAVAETSARKAGWRVQTISDIHAMHHRATGTETQSFTRAHFRVGKQNFVNGYDFLFMLLRCLKRLPKKPLIIGSSAMLAGYISSWIKQEPLEVPPDIVKYLRSEQRHRIFNS